MQNALDTFPDVLRIETVGKCNFRCIHCPNGTQPNMRSALTQDDFNFIVGQLIANNFIPRVVVLYHGGEPLLNKQLAHFIRTMKDLGVSKTVITTNASLLSKKCSEELIMAGLDEMKVSFDGESPDENNLIRKNANFYHDAANVKALCRLRKKLKRNNPAIIISNIRICSKGLLLKMNQSGQNMFPDTPAYINEYFKEEYHDIAFQSFPAYIWPGYENFGNLKPLYCRGQEPVYCGALFETFTILSNGNVVPCCYDIKGELVLGNVFETNMLDIWKDPEYTKLRTNFRLNKYHLFCRKCERVSPRYLCKEAEAV
jgi:radical SAM protein with 4Fe4S-binding SPASM domain